MGWAGGCLVSKVVLHYTTWQALDLTDTGPTNSFLKLLIPAKLSTPHAQWQAFVKLSQVSPGSLAPGLQQQRGHKLQHGTPSTLPGTRKSMVKAYALTWSATYPFLHLVLKFRA